MEGRFGKYLEADLFQESVSDYLVPEEWTEKYFGGRGIGARILVEELKGGEDPLGSKNILLFCTGPLQGTLVPGAGRHMVMGKSPKTGSVMGSYAGGFFAHELGTSGYDGIMIKGKADLPKFLALVEGKAEIKDAEDLWGMEVADADEELKDRYDGGRVACIGKAGENLVKFSAIMNDRNRASARPGFGAVMGSKNLKAVLVKGGIEKPIYDKERLNNARSEFVNSLSPAMDWGKIGSSGNMIPFNEMGILPTKNFQEVIFKGTEDISGETMYEEILTERDNCTGCPVRCKRVVKTEFLGEKVEERYGGPEYETIAAFGSNCLNDDLDSIALANQKCNKYGLDTISTGCIISLLMEATEKGLIEEDVEWGDAKAIIDLIDKIALREGTGDFLAKGIDHVAEEIGAEFAMKIKGQALPFHDPRVKKSLALSYATSPRGATHLETLHEHIKEHPFELKVDLSVNRLDLKTKPKFNVIYENLMSFTNSAILCWYASFDVMNMGNYVYHEIRELVKAVTGLSMDVESMLRIGERNFNLLKLLSGREGISREQNGLPERFEKPVPRGPTAGESIPKDELEECINRYYELRGWNDFGPTQKKLDELDMDLKAEKFY